MTALEACIASDELLEAFRATPASTPTKTIPLPREWIRDALATWIRSDDSTQSEKDEFPVSAADLKQLLDPAQSTEEIGRIDDFRLLRRLGGGGMAIVFEAEDARLKRRVALKLMHPAVAAKPGSAERFLREAQSAAALEHEHVVTIYQVGKHGQIPFIAMQLLRGQTLEECLFRHGRLDVRDVVRIGREIAMGLAAAHARGLLHRDIKPANIWLESQRPTDSEGPHLESLSGSTPSDVSAADGGHLRGERRDGLGKVKILDFGCAKSWSIDSDLTDPGFLVGTPAYMAPEQLSGTPVDPRADLFSLGCLLYQMTAGRRPFGGDPGVCQNLFTIVRSLAVDHPARLRDIDPNVPQALDDLVGELLSKAPEARPSSARVVVERLQAIEESLRPERQTAPPRPQANISTRPLVHNQE